MVSQQCSCSLPRALQGSNQPCIALLFHWKPFYQQFVQHRTWSDVTWEGNRGELEKLRVWKRLNGGNAEQGRLKGIELQRETREWEEEGWRGDDGGNSSKRLGEEQPWALDGDCLSSEQRVWGGAEGGEGEEWQERQKGGELCWERASKRALGWERRREMGAVEVAVWERRRRRRPAFFSREKANLTAEFRRLGIGACLAGIRGRQD